MKNSAIMFRAPDMTRRSHRTQKHKISVTCPSVLFVESVPVPPEHEKLCDDISCLEHTEMHYLAHRSHRMKIHKFDITYPNAFFIEFILVPPEHEK
jgi:hypothetical protein